MHLYDKSRFVFFCNLQQKLCPDLFAYIGCIGIYWYLRIKNMWVWFCKCSTLLNIWNNPQSTTALLSVLIRIYTLSVFICVYLQGFYERKSANYIGDLLHGSVRIFEYKVEPYFYALLISRTILAFADMWFFFLCPHKDREGRLFEIIRKIPQIFYLYLYAFMFYLHLYEFTYMDSMSMNLQIK